MFGGLVDNLHGGFGLVDNLYMTYEGNMLTSVCDVASRLPYAGATDFDGMPGENPLTYNASGSLVSDAGRGIARIDYDRLNNPVRIQFTNGSQTRYTYSAAGEKLLVEHYVAAPNVTVPFGAEPDALTQGQVMYAGSTQYLLGGSLVVKDGMTDRYLFDGGYAKAIFVNPTTYSFEFYYYNRDHLGNIREVVDSAGTVKQVTNYYPSGTPYADPAAVMNAGMQPYKYNGKELDRMHGLDTYDYGARQYDPVLGRWDRMDPLCEKYYSVSPYAYCGNNPVTCIDPDGKESMRTNGGENFKRTGILIMAGGALMVAAGTAYSIVTSGGGTVAGGGQLISAGVATFKAGFVTYGAGVALDLHESIKKPDSIKPSDVSQKAHTPKKQSTGSKKKTEGRHMHGQTHGGGPKPNFKSQNNKRKKADEHRNKGKVIN